MKLKTYTYISNAIFIGFILLSGLFLWDIRNMQATINNLELERDSLCIQNNSWLHKVDSVQAILDSLPLGSPLDTIIISGEFGIRRNPIYKGWQMHPGLDLKGTYTDTIYATGNGTIVRANRYGGYGRCVIIEHNGGYQSLYAHMNKVFVKKGDKVRLGQKLGTIGSTGFSTGAHLHYEISRFGKQVDPLYYLPS